MAKIEPEKQLGTQISSIQHALRHGPSLEDLGRRVLHHHERGDKGEINYTTTADAILHWAEDPHGKSKFRFMSEAYGIPASELPHVLEEMGLSEYVNAKEEGRMVGMVSTQILKPTYYFMANALLLGHLTQEHGIPTALMVGTYETDLFYPNNSDKVNAFGNIEFPVAVDPETHKLQSVKVHLVPVGLRQADGSIKPISSINEASGQQCNNIMVRVAKASDHKDKTYITGKGKMDVPDADDSSYYTMAALGIDIPQEEISLTDFYKAMWMHTIQALRDRGELPSEQEMPMFFVRADQMYGVLPQYATPPESTQRQLNTNNPAVGDKNITQLQSGVLVRKASGVMDPSWYYPMQYALPDLYYECSSCGGDNFVGKLANADRLIETYGLHSPEVRIPDKEVPELEALCIHPTGKYLDLMSVRREVDQHTLPLVEQIQSVQAEVARGNLDKSSGRHHTDMLKTEMDAIRVRMTEALVHAVRGNTGNADQHMESHPLAIPPLVAATYRALLGDVNNAINHPVVKQLLRGNRYA